MRRIAGLIAAMACMAGLIGAAPIPPNDVLDASYAGESETLTSASMRISMEFENAQLKDVLKVFSQQTGVNLIANQEVGERTLTLYLEDVTVMDALDQILESSDLVYERAAGSNIYLIKPKEEDEEEKEETVTRVYSLRYASVSKSTLAKAASALAAYVPGSGGASAVTSVGIAEEVGVDQVLEGLLTEFGSVEVDPRTNTLVITDVEENFPRLEATLLALDVRAPQLLIEAEVLETSLSKIKDLGVKWGGSSSTLATFAPGEGRTTRFPFNTFLADRFAPTGAGGRFGLSTLSFSDASAVLDALEKDTDTVILARPRVLTLDNQRAVIELATDEAVSFKRTTDQQSKTESVEAERTPTGVFLVVTPQINQGDELTLMVEPTVAKAAVSGLTPPATLGEQIKDPKVRSTRTVVRMQSGETLVLGGLIDRDESEIVQRVPGLSGIPFLGELFTHRDTDVTVSELIVFVTPTILREAPGAPQVAGALSHGLTERAQEGVGSRQELMERALERLEEPSF